MHFDLLKIINLSSNFYLMTSVTNHNCVDVILDKSNWKCYPQFLENLQLYLCICIFFFFIYLHNYDREQFLFNVYLLKPLTWPKSFHPLISCYNILFHVLRYVTLLSFKSYYLASISLRPPSLKEKHYFHICLIDMSGVLFRGFFDCQENGNWWQQPR